MRVVDKEVNLKYNGNRVISRTYTGKTFSYNEIKSLVKKMQDKYKNKNLKLMISINTPYGFRSAKAFNVNDDLIMLDDYEFDTTNAFIVYGWKDSLSQGGFNENNSCLFDCIVKLLGIYRLPKNFKTDLDLKKYLKIDVFDKIPLNKLPEVEKLYKININVIGDYVYTSKNNFNITINLSLINEHFEIQENNLKSKDLLKHIPNKKQKLIYIQYENDKIKAYDGNQIFYMTEEEYNEKSKNYFDEYAYLDKLPLEKSDIVDDYHKFIKECEKLKELTHGKIDLSKSGYKISNEALKCVHYDLLAFNEPEEITPLEQNWLINTFKGGLIFCKNNTKLKYAYSYDKNSAYPSMISSDHFSFPLKQGVFQFIDDLPNILTYGIYRVKIEKSKDENIDKLFRFNKMDYYTHYDINLARKLNLKMDLVKDGQSNCLLYKDGRANGSNYFRHIVHTLYDLKPKSALAKKILNAIWGALGTRNKIKKSTKQGLELNNGEILIDIKPTGNYHKVTYLKQNKFFKYSYARMGCFLTSAVRKQMAEIIYPHRENVYKCHTDSLLSDKPLDLLIGNFMGDFKLEKKGPCFILHSSKKVDWK